MYKVRMHRKRDPIKSLCKGVCFIIKDYDIAYLSNQSLHSTIKNNYRTSGGRSLYVHTLLDIFGDCLFDSRLAVEAERRELRPPPRTGVVSGLPQTGVNNGVVVHAVGGSVAGQQPQVKNGSWIDRLIVRYMYKQIDGLIDRQID